MHGLRSIARTVRSILCGLAVAALVLATLPHSAQASPLSQIALVESLIAPVAPSDGPSPHRIGSKPPLDTDGDGLSDWIERKRTKTSPRRRDTDGDRLSDWIEVRRVGTNPRRRDTDGDGLSDWVELKRTKTDPLRAESPSVPSSESAGPDANPEPPPPPPDTTPPQTAITSASAPANSDSAAFGFEANEAGASFECRLDGAAFADCVSPKEYAGLTDGSHTFEVRAIDKAGNVDQSPASLAWTVDTAPPAVQINSGPIDLTNDSTPTFGFSSELGANLECSIDSGNPSFGPCSGPSSHTPAAPLGDGPHAFRVRAKDAAGNQATATRQFAVDTAAPDAPELTATTPGSPANDNDPLVIGDGPAGTTVRLYVGIDCAASPVATVSVAALESGVAVTVGDDSTTVFHATATTAASNTSGCSEPLTYVEDSSAPGTTITAQPTALTSSAMAKFEFSGSDGSGSGIASFECRRDGGAWGACTSPKEYAGLADGAHTVEVKAIDKAGNVDGSPASFTWSIDTAAPNTTITSQPETLTNSPNASFGISGNDGAGSGVASFQCRIDSSGPGDWAACPSPKQYAGLSDGAHTFEARAIDDAGNADQSAVSFAWTVDTTAPAVQVNFGPSGLTSNPSPTFAFSSEPGAGFECSVDEGTAAFGACSGASSHTPAASLGDGAHTFRVRAKDAAGNQAAATRSFEVDASAPNTTITLQPAALTNSATAKFEFNGSDGSGSGIASLECRRDGGTWGVCTSPKEYTGLADGAHSFEVKAIDKAGNVDGSPASSAWSIDTAAPNTTITSQPAALTSSMAAKFEFSGNDGSGSGIASFECRRDSGSWSACTAPMEYVGLADGGHTFDVRAIDKAGNVDSSLASFAWTIDSAAPSTTITSQPAALANSATAKFEFSGSDGSGSGIASFECRRDGGTWGACTSPKEYAGLADGPHSFEVKTIDKAGNVDGSPASFGWTIDTTAPVVQVNSGPTGLTGNPSPTFGFSSEAGVSLECSIDTGTAAFGACSGPSSHTPAASLGDGTQTFRVRAKDAAGNQATATRGFEVDASAPNTTITGQPAPLTSGTTAKFEFSGSDGSGSGVASFECRRDGGTWGACSSPKEYVGLADGAHTFEVKAIDKAGNVDPIPASLAWTVDSTAPNTTITGQPTTLTNNATAKFEFSGSDGTGSGIASFECRIDSSSPSGWAACSSPKQYTGLSDGSHTLEVKAIDKAGNADGSPASFAWNIDTAAPNTTITLQPAALTNSAAAKFEFNGSDGSGSGVASFECRRDGGVWGACTSPREYTGLADGAHSFEVKAIDKAGNVDGSPASFAWNIDAASPNTTITGQPSTLTKSTAAKFEFSGNDGTGSGIGSLECRRDGGTWSVCTSPKEYTGLADGAHSFEVKAIDKAGNVDPTPATSAWTVDTTPPSVTIDSGPIDLTNDSTPTFGFSSEPGVSFECSIDTGTAAFSACSGVGSHTPAAPLPDGPRTFRVRATDAAGNQATATRAFTIDTAAPDAPQLTATAPLSPANNNNPLVIGDAPAGTTVKLYVGAGCAGSPVATVSVAALKAGIAVTVGDDSTTVFHATATTAANNTSGCSESLVYVEDSSPPNTTITLQPPALTNSATAKFEFSGSDGSGSGIASLECRRDGGTWGACTSPKEYTGLADSSHAFEVKAVDKAGNVDSTPASFSWTVDTAPPAVQVNSGPSGLTSNPSPSFTFSSEAGAGFECSIDEGTAAFGPCSSAGSHTPAAPLPDGPRTFRVRAKDAAGNQATATRGFEVDASAPNTTITLQPAALTNSSTAKFEFSGSDGSGSGIGSFECRRDGGTWGACNSPKEYTGLADGAHTFEVKATDKAGNAASSAGASNWSIDTTAPQVQIDSGPSPISNTANANFAFSASDSGGSGIASLECRRDAEAWTTCSSPKSYSSLSEGTHSFELRATDNAGNLGLLPAPHEWVIDTQGPNTTITGQPAVLTSSTTAKFEFSGNDGSGTGIASFECRRDEGTWGACTSPKEYVGLTDGAHSFEVKAIDKAGNVDPSPASFDWTVDTASPDTAIILQPAALTNSATAKFEFSGSDGSGSGIGSFECRRDGGTWGVCTSPKEYTGLADGAHTFEVKAIDKAGNVDPIPASLAWTVDSTAPNTTITGQPTTLTNSATAKFEFSGSDGSGSGVALFECRRDGGTWSACTSPKEYTGLTDGAHTFEVRAIDKAGNIDQSAASFGWTVDTTAPVVQIDSLSKSLLRAGQTSEVSWHAGENGAFELRVGVTSCDTGTVLESGNYSNQPAAHLSNVTAAQLAEGANTLRLCITDAAGNRGQASTVLSKDTVAPDTTITLQPATLTNSATTKFEFSGSDGSGSGVASFECRRDGGAWGACTSPKEYAGLADGAHTFEVKAIDKAGNVDGSPASFGWSVDTLAPNTTITSQPPTLTTSAAAKFEFSGNDGTGSGVASLQCRIDSSSPGDWAACPSPKQYTGLTDGPHTFEVRAIDKAGNIDQSAASFGWTVDTTAPLVQIDSGPIDLTNDSTPTFGFSSEPGVSFECSIDSGTAAFGSCSGVGSHTPAAPLPDGPRTFRVRATDAAGNQATATRAFTVDTAAPDAPTLTATAPLSPANNNGPLVIGDAPAGTTVKLYAGAGCAGSPLATVPVATLKAGIAVTVADDSTTVLHATATTAANNTSGCSEPLTYVEDSSAPNTTITLQPPALTNSATAKFEFSGSDGSGSGVASFECRRDGGTWGACTSPKEYASLADGAHTFEVKATDKAGNVDASAATFGWTVDTTAPLVAVDSLSKSLLRMGQTSEVSWHAGENGAFELRVGGTSCDTGTVLESGTYSNQPAAHLSNVTAAQLAEGANTLRLCITDAASNRGQVSVVLSKDTVEPDTQIGTKPAASTNSTAAEIGFSGSDGSGSGVAFLECRLDGKAWATCISPRQYTGLVEGAHDFEVKAIDSAGNADGTPASVDWTVDTTAPVVQIDSGPIDLTNNPTPTFGFSSEPGTGFQCSVDSGTAVFGACSATSSHTPAIALANGPYIFRVRATDAAGNQATVTRGFEVDSTAPDTPQLTVTVPASPANQNTLQIFGKAVTGTTVKLYTGTNCSGSAMATITAAELEAGFSTSVADDSTTVFRATIVSAERTSGCSEPLVYIEDSTAPQTTISAAPPATTMSTSASFFFTANEPGASFECAFDGADYTSCSSPLSFADLATSSHSFSVRATDAAGNLDLTPVSWSGTIEPPPSTPPSACAEGGTVAITAAAIRSAVQAGHDVCVTADVGNVNLSGLGSKPVVVSSEAGSMGDVDLDSTTDLTISRARFRSIEMRSSHRTQLYANTIGGTQASRVLDQLIFMPNSSNDVVIEGNDIGWTIADSSGNTGYGCRCYGDLNRLRFVGNKVHDIAADGFQGVGGTDVLIDRNEIGPVGRNPESNEHSDNIQITDNDANLRITNNWIHHQGYYEGTVTANSGATYIHGGSADSLVYENNLIEIAQGRTEICGLGTGGRERSNITIRRNTWVDGGKAFTSFPGFEWDCSAGSGNRVERNIAIDPDGGLKMSGFSEAATFSANLWGQPSLVTLDASGNCTSANCNPDGQEPIGYRKPSGVGW